MPPIQLPPTELPPDPLEIPNELAALTTPGAEDPRELPDEDFALWVTYILQRWGFFILYIVDPHIPVLEGPPTIIPVENGYPIYDYGNYLATSPCDELILCSDSTLKLLVTVSTMIQLAVDAGAKEVAFSGHEIAKRKAWFDLEFHKDSTLVINFTPEFKEQALYANMKRLEPIYGVLRHEPLPWSAPTPGTSAPAVHVEEETTTKADDKEEDDDNDDE